MSDLVTPRSIASARMGAWMPVSAIRILFAAVAVTLCFTQLQPGFWFGVGIALVVLAIARPRLLAPWGLIILLGASVLWRQPSATDWRFYLLLAALHLLHLLGAQLLVLPWRGRIQLRSYRMPLLRFLAIQLPAQLAAASALLLFAPHGPLAIGIPIAGLVASLAIVGLVAAVVWPLLEERRH